MVCVQEVLQVLIAELCFKSVFILFQSVLNNLMYPLWFGWKTDSSKSYICVTVKVRTREQSEQKLEAVRADEAMHANLALQRARGSGEPANRKASVPLMKIRFNAKYESMVESIAKRQEAVATSFSSAKDSAESMRNTQPEDEGEDGGVDPASDLLTELEAHNTSAVTHLELLKTKLVAVHNAAANADNVDVITTASSELKSLMATMNTGPVKHFQNSIRSINALSMQRKRAGGRVSVASAKKKSLRDRVKPPLHSILFNFEAKSHNISLSVYEAKGGLRAAVSSINSDKQFQAILTHSQVRKCMKTNASGMKTGNSHVSSMITGSALMEKRFRDLMTVSCNSELFSRQSLPRAAWAPNVFKFDLQSCDDAYVYFGWTHMGLMESWLVLSGDVTFVGIPHDSVAGSTFRDKRSSIHQIPEPELRNLINNGGWMVNFTNGLTEGGCSVLTIPSGFMTLWGGKDAHMLRWSLSGDERDLQRVKFTLQSLIDGFPELRSNDTSYPQFAAFLGLRT